MSSYHAIIAVELSIRENQVAAVAALLEEGSTVPFIARYRKEATGSLDEVAIAAIRDRLEQLAELDKRRDAILKSLTERELLTDKLAAAIAAADSLSLLEDIYLPYRPKRRTRATIAREKGLEPLAIQLLAQEASCNPEEAAASFVNAEKGVESNEEALAGARDIIAETINEDSTTRARLRETFAESATLASKLVKKKESEAAKFRDYFEWEEGALKAPSHRVLAMLRGEDEGCLSLQVRPPEASAHQELRQLHVKGDSPAADQVGLAVEDAYKRLLGPSMENEIRQTLKETADTEAIRVFTENLRELLMSAPLGQKRVLAIDPGFRTGCKVVCLDAQGQLLHDTVIYPTMSQARVAESKATLLKLVETYDIEAIAIGNGTASRETESFVKGCGLPASILVVQVNESGASIYSASEVARAEFPDHDVTVRGAVSIGRRLMDPLAELVKIDPKSIGVGQYQHDVDQGRLKAGLDDTVMSCVNGVGVELNTASQQLLTYVSGLGPALAKNIVEYRNENGAFKSRTELKKVKRLGAKAFEQAAGFLRVRGAKNPLDTSGVHPERYKLVDRMAKDQGIGVAELMANEEKRRSVKLDTYVDGDVGLPTLTDIMDELAKPGRDPRDRFEAFSFAEGVEKPEDLSEGMRLHGIVTNVTNFGAFVDVGVHQDGLVHISQLADTYVSDPATLVKVGQTVSVTVLEVDLDRNRISLSMKSDPEAKPQRRENKSTPQQDRTPSGQRKGREKRPQRSRQASKPAKNWLQDALKKG
ncbi:MAG: Tex family protein [Planctomycetota bacterium]|jgi:uncharacterized protein